MPPERSTRHRSSRLSHQRGENVFFSRSERRIRRTPRAKFGQNRRLRKAGTLPRAARSAQSFRGPVRSGFVYVTESNTCENDGGKSKRGRSVRAWPGTRTKRGDVGSMPRIRSSVQLADFPYMPRNLGLRFVPRDQIAIKTNV